MKHQKRENTGSIVLILEMNMIIIIITSNYIEKIKEIISHLYNTKKEFEKHQIICNGIKEGFSLWKDEL